LAGLPASVCATLSSFIKNPPTTDKYKGFRKAVIEAARPPRAERFRLWLECSLGDRKPSDFLQFLHTLEPQPDAREFFRQNFLNKLPQSVREALSARDDLTLAQLADQADKLVGEKRAAQDSGRINHVEGEICYVRRSNDNYNQDNRSNNNKHNNQDNSSNNNKNNHQNEPSKDGLCYAHNRYGEKAWSCKQPCTWSTALAPRPVELNTIFPGNYVRRVEADKVGTYNRQNKRPCFYHGKFGQRARKCAGPTRCSWRHAQKGAGPSADAGPAPRPSTTTSRPRVPPTAVTAVAPAGGGSNLPNEEQERERLKKKQQQYENYVRVVKESYAFREGLINPSEEEMRADASMYAVLAKKN
jgi:hypothetical protein